MPYFKFVAGKLIRNKSYIRHMFFTADGAQKTALRGLIPRRLIRYVDSFLSEKKVLLLPLG